MIERARGNTAGTVERGRGGGRGAEGAARSGGGRRAATTTEAIAESIDRFGTSGARQR